MTQVKTVHVMRSFRGRRWQARAHRSNRARSSFASRRDALLYAVRWVSGFGGRVYVHKSDATIDFVLEIK